MNHKNIIMAVSLFVSGSVLAGNLDPLPQFEANTPASSTAVNNNFDALRVEVNDNAQVQVDHENDPASHHAPFTDTDVLNAVSSAGINSVTSGLISTQFTSEYSNSEIAIPDNNPDGIVSVLSVPDVGIINSIILKMSLTNSDTSTISAILTDPNGAEYVLHSGGLSGTEVSGVWPDPDNFISGDITSWLGVNPVGDWSLKVVDSGFLNNTTDGQVNSWSLTLKGLSNSTATINGDLAVEGNVRMKSYGNNPAITPVKLHFNRGSSTVITYSAPNGTVYTLNITNPSVASGNSHIYYSPTGTSGTGSALLFNIDNSPSIACTLLHNEDDLPESSANLIWATDGGNTAINTTAWGNSTTSTFMLTNPTTPGVLPILAFRSYAIICF